jgi:hypothetical protein
LHLTCKGKRDAENQPVKATGFVLGQLVLFQLFLFLDAQAIAACRAPENPAGEVKP